MNAPSWWPQTAEDWAEVTERERRRLWEAEGLNMALGAAMPTAHKMRLQCQRDVEASIRRAS